MQPDTETPSAALSDDTPLHTVTLREWRAILAESTEVCAEYSCPTRDVGPFVLYALMRAMSRGTKAQLFADLQHAVDALAAQGAA